MLDCAQAPPEGYESDDRVYVETELRKRASSTCQDGDEAINACDLVQQLQQGGV